MNYRLLYIGCAFLALAFVLGLVAHNFSRRVKSTDDPAWASGLVGAAFIIAAIVSIWT